MKYLITLIILIAIPLLSPVVCHAQVKDSIPDNDKVILGQTSLFIRKLDSIRIADSIKRATLVAEIELLKGSEANRQRQELLKKLKEEEAEDSLHEARLRRQLDKLKSTAKGFPVTPFSDTLFFIYTQVGSFSPQDRAAAIADKINKLYSSQGFHPDSLLLSKNESATDIVFHDMVVMSVNELEARWQQTTSANLAQGYREKIVEAIQQEKKANSIRNIIIRIVEIILIIIGIYLLILLINKLHLRLRKKVIELKDKILHGIKFRGYQFLDSNRELRLALGLLNIIRWFLVAIALYFMLPLLFSVFPWTKGIAETMLRWVLTPLGSVWSALIEYLPNLFTILVIMGITHYVVKFLEFVTSEIEEGTLTIPNFYPDWAKPTLILVKVLLYAFSFIIIFPYLPGSDSPIFQGVSLFLGLLFSMGSSTAISNAVAGFVITYMRPFKVGDRIKIGDITGDVIEKSLLVTRVRTIKNEDITIPNASVLSGHTINYSTAAKELGLILHTSVTIGYDVPWKQVHELLIKAARASEGIMKDENHKPFVLQTSLDDFYVSYQLNAYTDQPQRIAAIYSELHQNIQDKFNEGGVEILSPHYRSARDGNMTTIPASYLPKDYQAPSFIVSMNKPTEEK